MREWVLTRTDTIISYAVHTASRTPNTASGMISPLYILVIQVLNTGITRPLFFDSIKSFATDKWVNCLIQRNDEHALTPRMAYQ